MSKLVSEIALYSRINRKLRHQGKILRKTRGMRGWSTLGDYYTVDIDRNIVIDTHIDVRGLAADLGCLYPGEEVRQ